jgi:hypothetical protein
MQPLAEWHCDTECIINRKPNVEQVEAVNPRSFRRWQPGVIALRGMLQFRAMMSATMSKVDGIEPSSEIPMVDAPGPNVIPLLSRL